MGDSYTMGVVSALCDSQDPDVRSAAVKAIGRCEADSKAQWCMCVLQRCCISRDALLLALTLETSLEMLTNTYTLESRDAY